jgi:hypothetical protein
MQTDVYRDKSSIEKLIANTTKIYYFLKDVQLYYNNNNASNLSYSNLCQRRTIF